MCRGRRVSDARAIASQQPFDRPRRTHPEIPGIALHITQRGVNRTAVFVDDDARGHALARSGATLRKTGITASEAACYRGTVSDPGSFEKRSLTPFFPFL